MVSYFRAKVRAHTYTKVHVKVNEGRRSPPDRLKQQYLVLMFDIRQRLLAVADRVQHDITPLHLTISYVEVVANLIFLANLCIEDTAQTQEYLRLANEHLAKVGDSLRAYAASTSKASRAPNQDVGR